MQTPFENDKKFVREGSGQKVLRLGTGLRAASGGSREGIGFLSRDTVKATSSRGLLYPYPAKEA